MSEIGNLKKESAAGREFKFRVWNKRVNAFAFFDTPQFDFRKRDSDGGLEPFVSFENADIPQSGGFPCGGWGEVEQFVGLKDKNGKDIYEGDVVLFHWTEEGTAPPHQIKWESAIASFRLGNLSMESLFESGFYQPHPSDIQDAKGRKNGLEIIGHIHETEGGAL